MPRPNRSAERRRELLPKLAQAFADSGYRRTTTAELARRCDVQETVIYRLWRDKKSMFAACIDYIYEVSRDAWLHLLEQVPAGSSAAEHLLQYEAGHLGELGMYRIVFAGLSETDDPEIRRHLQTMCRRFQRFISGQVASHRRASGGRARPGAEVTAWAIVGLGTAAYVGRELGLLSSGERALLVREAGRLLLEGWKG
jgi:AcrR family transcriptional regulator